MVWLTATGDKCVAIHCKAAWRELLGRSSFLVGGFYTRMGTDDESALRSAQEPLLEPKPPDDLRAR